MNKFSPPRCMNGSRDGEMTPVILLSFTSLVSVLVFGVITAVLFILQLTVNTIKGEQFFSFITLKDDFLFPQWQLILIGVLGALSGLFVEFTAIYSRTAPFLQAILGNFTIPLIIFFRMAILRKNPTILKLLSAMAVLLAAMFSSFPTIFSFNENTKIFDRIFFEQSIASRVLWPLGFMLGFIPAALTIVFEEKSLKDTRKVNLFYLLFWTSLYQLIVLWLMFWTDLIPHFGYSGSARQFGENYKFTVHCFFGGSGCDYHPGLSGTFYFVFSVMSYVGGGLLLRYSDGATYFAVVLSPVVPLASLFWSIFDMNMCAHLVVNPQAADLTYFSVAGIVIMVPAIVLYNIGTFETLKEIFRKISAAVSPRRQIQYGETAPLIGAARPYD